MHLLLSRAPALGLVVLPCFVVVWGYLQVQEVASSETEVLLGRVNEFEHSIDQSLGRVALSPAPLAQGPFPRHPQTRPVSAPAYQGEANGSSREAPAAGPASSPAVARPSLRQCTSEKTNLFNPAGMHTGQEGGFDVPVWQPGDRKYLIMVCWFGQMSNQEHCLLRHLLLAGWLNRTLVVDTDLEWSRYRWAMLFDFGRVQRCLGPNTVISVKDYRAARGTVRPFADMFLCLGYKCGLPAGLARELEGIRVNISAFAPGQDIKTVREWLSIPWVLSASSLVVNDLYGPLYPWDNVPLPFPFRDLPFRRVEGCQGQLLVAPPEDAFKHAREYQQSRFKGEPLLAVHWRRGGFLVKYCTPFWGDRTIVICLPPKDVARCIAAKAQDMGLGKVLLCTNGNNSEIVELRDALSKNPEIDLEINPSLPASFPPGESGEADVSYQKAVLTVADVFLGTERSSFSLSIERLRVNLGTGTCHDATICEGYGHLLPQKEQ